MAGIGGAATPKGALPLPSHSLQPPVSWSALGTFRPDYVEAPNLKKAMGAILQLFHLCKPDKRATICRADLESVLQHLGRGKQVSSILGVLAECRHGGTLPERFDFMRYWRGMEHLFLGTGFWPKPEEEGKEDVISGMRGFRDGVLRQCGQQKAPGAISSQELLALLGTIQSNSLEPEYWQEVMRIIPNEDSFGLTLLEVSEAIYAWLQDYLKARSEEKEGQAWVAPPREPQCAAPSPPFSLQPDLWDLLAEDGLASPSLPVRGWLTGLHKDSSSYNDAGGPKTSVLQLQRLRELTQILVRLIDAKDAIGHSALTQLMSVHESLARSLNDQEAEAGRLRRSNEALCEKQRQLEAELARAHRLPEVGQDAAVQPDQQRRQAKELEQETKKDHYSCTGQEMDRLRAIRIDSEQDRPNTECREWHEHNCCSQPESADGLAEGQAHLTSSKADCQAAGLSAAEAQVQLLRQDVLSWRWKCFVLGACSAARSQGESATACLCHLLSHSFSAQTAEPGTAPVAASAGAGPPATRPTDDPQSHWRRQRTELQQLRADPGNFFLASSNQAASRRAENSTSASPQHAKIRRRFVSLSVQLRALLKHVLEVEQLLDIEHDAHLGSDTLQNVKQQLSMQRVQEEGEAVVKELSKRLYSLEVQKSDADEEIRQLKALTAEQNQQLRAGHHCQEELLAELGAALQASREVGTCQRAGGVLDLQACHKTRLHVGSNTSVTSLTRSVSSGSAAIGTASSASSCTDPISSFLTPFQGTLRSSPKGSNPHHDERARRPLHRGTRKPDGP